MIYYRHRLSLLVFAKCWFHSINLLHLVQTLCQGSNTDKLKWLPNHIAIMHPYVVICRWYVLKEYPIYHLSKKTKILIYCQYALHMPQMPVHFMYIQFSSTWIKLASLISPLSSIQSQFPIVSFQDWFMLMMMHHCICAS